jgi:hypothetical protein
MRSTVKVLELPSFFSIEHAEEDLEWLTMVELIGMGRDGWYYDRLTKQSWYECRGRTYLCRAEDFLHHLHTSLASELRPEDVRGLNAICQSRLATATQRKLAYDHWAFFATREVGRNARRWRTRILNTEED